MANIMMILTEDGKIEAVDKGTCDLLGYMEEELVEKDVPFLFSGEEIATLRGVGLQQAIQSGSIQDKQASLQTKSGETIPVSLSGSVLRSQGGEFFRAVLIAHDITEQKRVEERLHLIKLEQEQEIVSRNKELETLLYVTSHDLKEPLRAIQHFSGMIAEEHAKDLNPEGKDLFGRVARASQRLGSLLDDIVSLTRARKIEKPTSLIDGQIIVNEALSNLDEMVRKVGATVKLVGTFPALYVDRVWAVAAVYNLISNALKYKKDNGPPEIEIAPYDPPAGDPDAVGIGFVVKDRGPGVAPEYAEIIFELFKRCVGREVEGTGAGLAIVREVARRHGGRAWVRPREGGGSEFIVTFGR